ncbi:MAG: gas vesicle protein K [Pseudomonadota bacterium]
MRCRPTSPADQAAREQYETTSHWHRKHNTCRPSPGDGHEPTGKPGRDLVMLLLAIMHLLRDLMELQALRRLQQGTLALQDADRLGSTLAEARGKLEEIAATFGVTEPEMATALSSMVRVVEPDDATGNRTFRNHP